MRVYVVICEDNYDEGKEIYEVYTSEKLAKKEVDELNEDGDENACVYYILPIDVVEERSYDD